MGDLYAGSPDAYDQKLRHRFVNLTPGTVTGLNVDPLGVRQVQVSYDSSTWEDGAKCR